MADILRSGIPLYKGFLDVRRHGEIELVHPGDSVAAIVHHPDSGWLYFVKQARKSVDLRLIDEHNGLKEDTDIFTNYCLRKNFFELVAGYCESNESPGTAIIREVCEELGLRSSNIISSHPFPIPPYFTDVGCSTAFQRLYYVQISKKPDVDKLHGMPSEGECTSVFMAHESQLMSYLPICSDAKTLLGITLFLSTSRSK